MKAGPGDMLSMSRTFSGFGKGCARARNVCLLFTGLSEGPEGRKSKIAGAPMNAHEPQSDVSVYSVCRLSYSDRF